MLIWLFASSSSVFYLLDNLMGHLKGTAQGRWVSISNTLKLQGVRNTQPVKCRIIWDTIFYSMYLGICAATCTSVLNTALSNLLRHGFWPQSDPHRLEFSHTFQLPFVSGGIASALRDSVKSHRRMIQTTHIVCREGWRIHMPHPERKQEQRAFASSQLNGKGVQKIGLERCPNSQAIQHHVFCDVCCFLHTCPHPGVHAFVGDCDSNGEDHYLLCIVECDAVNFSFGRSFITVMLVFVTTHNTYIRKYTRKLSKDG